MKNNKTKNTVLAAINMLAAAAFVVVLFQISSCVPETPVDPLVDKTWKVKTVTLDGVDVTSKFTGLTLKFNSDNNATIKTITSTNGGTIWPDKLGWSYVVGSLNKKFLRADNQIGVSVTFNTDNTTLDLELSWPTTNYAGGKISSVKGNYVFKMIL